MEIGARGLGPAEMRKVVWIGREIGFIREIGTGTGTGNRQTLVMAAGAAKEQKR